jgi:hypothetical protein
MVYSEPADAEFDMRGHRTVQLGTAFPQSHSESLDLRLAWSREACVKPGVPAMNVRIRDISQALCITVARRKQIADALPLA